MTHGELWDAPCSPACPIPAVMLGYLVRWYTPGRLHRMANPFGFADIPDPR